MTNQPTLKDYALVCSRCGRFLPEAAFTVDKSKPHGRRYSCRECEHYRRRGRHTPGRRNNADRNKNLARGRLRDAVKYGKVEKPKHCQRCKAATPAKALDGHHEDYSRPLDVVWLCRSCHGLAHIRWAA